MWSFGKQIMLLSFVYCCPGFLQKCPLVLYYQGQECGKKVSVIFH